MTAVAAAAGQWPMIAQHLVLGSVIGVMVGVLLRPLVLWVRWMKGQRRNG